MSYQNVKRWPIGVAEKHEKPQAGKELIAKCICILNFHLFEIHFLKLHSSKHAKTTWYQNRFSYKIAW